MMGTLVVKDNALVEASYRLSEVEQRLILLAILKARSVGDSIEQLKDKELTIYVDDYIKTFGVDRDAGYKSLKKAVMGLYRAEWGYKYINSKGNVVIAYERFTQSAKYIENEATIKFMFANAIIPMLIELERNFTSYEIKQIAELSSQYAMRLYEFLIQHLDKKANKGWLNISLEDLRFRFGLLPTEYMLMSDFKKRVLDFAMKQVNENTDLSVTYTQKKQGRTIIGFKFEYKRKTKKIKTQDTNILDITEPYQENSVKPTQNHQVIIHTLTELQAKKYATKLKLHPKILEFFGALKDENAFYQKVYQVLTEPDSVNKKAQNVVFTALFRDTDYEYGGKIPQANS